MVVIISRDLRVSDSCPIIEAFQLPGLRPAIAFTLSTDPRFSNSYHLSDATLATVAADDAAFDAEATFVEHADFIVRAANTSQRYLRPLVHQRQPIHSRDLKKAKLAAV